MSLARPLEAVPAFLTNVIARVTGERDDRYGRAATQALLTGERLISAGLREAAKRDGVVGTSTSALRTILPVAGIGLGASQLWKGWNELEHKDSPLDLVHNRTARSGALQIAAGTLWFVPGVGGALAGAGMRAAAAANELDAFDHLDHPSTSVERRGVAVARSVHPLDPTPLNPDDRLRDALAQRADNKARERQPERGPDPLGHALLWVRDQLT